MSDIEIKPSDNRVIISKDCEEVTVTGANNNVLISGDSGSVRVSSTGGTVSISPTTESVNIIGNGGTVIISPVGTEGPQGPEGPEGPIGPAGPAGSLSGIDVAGDVEYTGTETTLSNGLVSECLYRGDTVYRFESTAETSNGSLVEDSFYLNFDGTNLSNLLVRRNYSG